MKCNLKQKNPIEKPEYVNKTFRITKELAETLSEIAQREGISVNELVVQCCNYAISNMDVSEDTKEQIYYIDIAKAPITLHIFNEV